MNPSEGKERFLAARNRLHRIDCRLDWIRLAMEHLMATTITVPGEILDRIERDIENPDRNYYESEPDLTTDDRAWIADARRGPVPLFHHNTLCAIHCGLIPELAVISYFSSGSVDSSNVASGLANITDKCKNDIIPGHLRPTNAISFEGFTEDEIRRIVTAYEKRVVTACHRLRDIHTQMRYLTAARLKLHSAFGSIKDAPDHLRVNRAWTSGDRLRDDVAVFGEFWLNRVVGEVRTKDVLEQFRVIETSSRPRAGEPDTIRFFSSHASNHISYEQIAE